MITKASDLHIKLLDDAGSIEGIASRYGILDRDGEQVDSFAFAEDLKSHAGKGLPILFQHDRTQPIGWTTGAHETRDALHVSGKLSTSGKGREVYDLIKLGIATGASPNLSIGFTVPPGGSYVEKGVKHFKRAQLKEWSIVTFGACPSAAITAVKSANAIGSQLQQAIAHIQAGRHDEAIKLLGSLAVQLPYPWGSLNLPNPVGGGKSFSPEIETMIAELDAFLAR